MKKSDILLQAALSRGGLLGQEQLDGAVKEAQRGQENLVEVLVRNKLVA